MSNAMLNTLANATPEDWQKVDLDKLMREANSLVRVAAHKNRVDVQNQNEIEKAFNEYKGMFFTTLAKKHPDLCQQMKGVLEDMREEI